VGGAWRAQETSLEEQLIFIISPPRAGSTLLNRMLGTHDDVYAPEEPHLLTPLAHLGYYEMVREAPYDPSISQRGVRAFVEALPGGEADYLDGLRAYTDTLYGRALAPTGARFLLDKTPAYALVLPFVAKLYPKAKFVVLTRHPMAIWSSVVESFFDGDHEAAHTHNPIIERYVPAIARFLDTAPVPFCHVKYEELVQDPEAEMKRICEFVGLEFDPAIVDYGDRGGAKQSARGLGDPMTVAKQSRPTTDSLAKWAVEMTGRPDKVAQCRDILAALGDAELATWGHSRAAIGAELDAIDLEGKPSPPKATSRYTLERRLLVSVRRRVGDNALGRFVRKVREACDILLR